MRILAYDVETRPATVFTWTLWQPTIGLEQIIDPGGMMSFAAQWVGEKKVEFRSDHHDGHEAMIRRIWELFDEADATLTFNGDRFDRGVVQREFMELGLAPPSPTKSIDLYKVVKRQARFISNKLAHVLPQLGLDGKTENGGFALWKACMAGDDGAWQKMKRYNCRDVTALIEAYEILRPWISGHPSYGAHSGTDDCCTKCGSTRLTRRGFAPKRTGRYQRYVCKDCSSWNVSTKRHDSTNIAELAI